MMPRLRGESRRHYTHTAGRDHEIRRQVRACAGPVRAAVPEIQRATHPQAVLSHARGAKGGYTYSRHDDACYVCTYASELDKDSIKIRKPPD